MAARSLAGTSLMLTQLQLRDNEQALLALGLLASLLVCLVNTRTCVGQVSINREIPLPTVELLPQV